MLPINLHVAYDLSQEYHQKRIREAEEYRMLQRLKPNRPSQWARGLAQLGSYLIVAGAWLKRRYDPGYAMQLRSNY